MNQSVRCSAHRMRDTNARGASLALALVDKGPAIVELGQILRRGHPGSANDAVDLFLDLLLGFRMHCKQPSGSEMRGLLQPTDHRED
jgi:hypothetical protein